MHPGVSDCPPAFALKTVLFADDHNGMRGTCYAYSCMHPLADPAFLLDRTFLPVATTQGAA